MMLHELNRADITSIKDDDFRSARLPITGVEICRRSLKMHHLRSLQNAPPFGR